MCRTNGGGEAAGARRETHQLEDERAPRAGQPLIRHLLCGLVVFCAVLRSSPKDG